ncbi:MAG: DUF481 domain-containing protein [Acidobacteria bacterium]|nr:DUF481 domain-containing protein [Acidobacteriota bacterium]
MKALIVGLVPAALLGQAPAAPTSNWTDKASLSYVAVGGNAQSQSLGFANEYLYQWVASSLAFNLSGVRVNTTTIERSASGTSATNYTLVETTTQRTTSEAYTALLRYDHKFTEHSFWFGAGTWDRNRPAGLDNRYKGILGVGNAWVDSGRTKLRTDYGFGYTQEDPLFRPEGFTDSYATWQLGAKLEQKVLETSAFASELSLSGSLKEGRDWFGTLKNTFTTTLSQRLALKVGYDLAYRNRPHVLGIDILEAPVATPPVVLGKAPVELKTLDTVFTTSLVITF